MSNSSHVKPLHPGIQEPQGLTWSKGELVSFQIPQRRWEKLVSSVVVCQASGHCRALPHTYRYLSAVEGRRASRDNLDLPRSRSATVPRAEWDVAGPAEVSTCQPQLFSTSPVLLEPLVSFLPGDPTWMLLTLHKAPECGTSPWSPALLPSPPLLL